MIQNKKTVFKNVSIGSFEQKDFFQTNLKSNFSVWKRSQEFQRAQGVWVQGVKEFKDLDVEITYVNKYQTLTRGHEMFDLNKKSNSSDAVSEWAARVDFSPPGIWAFS